MDIAKLGISVDTKDIRSAGNDLDNFSRKAGSAEGVTRRATSALKAFAGALALGATFRTVIANTIEQERVTAQLEQTLKSTGRYTPELSRQMQDYASSLQNVTTYGDEAIIGAQALLLTFTQIGGEAFPRAQEAILDVATAMGTDLKSATLQVGKALNDPVLGMTALSRSGIQFTEAQKEMVNQMVATGRQAEAQNVILAELERQFGGSAKAARNTLGGALQSLKNAFGDLLEGDSGGDGVRGAAEALNDLTDLLSDPATKQAFADVTTGVLGVVSALAKGVTLFAEFGRAIGENIGKMVMPELDTQIDQAQSRLNQLLDEFNRPRLTRINPFISSEKIGQEIHAVRQELDRLISYRDTLSSMAQGPSGDGLTIVPPSVPALIGETSGEVRTLSDEVVKLHAANQELVDGFALEADVLGMTRTEMELYKLELNGATDAQIQAAATALALVEAYDEQARAQRELVNLEREREQLRIADAAAVESVLQSMMTQEELLQLHYDRRLEIIRNSVTLEEEEKTRIMLELEQQRQDQLAQMEAQRTSMMLQNYSGLFDGLAGMAKAYAGEQSGIYKAMFAVSKAFAIADAIIKIQQGIASAAAIPFPANIPAMATVAASTAGIVSTISGTNPSFDGGGYTGNGPRSGGLDGKGGFMAMMHPRETVVDHTKGQGMGVVVNINNAPPGTQVKERQGDDGQQIIDVFVANVRSGGQAAQVMEQTYGMARRGQ